MRTDILQLIDHADLKIGDPHIEPCPVTIRNPSPRAIRELPAPSLAVVVSEAAIVIVVVVVIGSRKKVPLLQ